MSAAPAEDPTPWATSGLPPAKRKKKDPSCLESSPVLPATGGWSSLPGDLVRRIADSFLATNDLDHYMYLRAVCPSWRAVTDGPPADNTSDPRFYPRAWIILDEVFLQGDKDDEQLLLLLNTETGRFLRKKLPLLRDYYVVATTPGGFFVLADRSPPHAARLFSPLTGALTRFVAPVPPEVSVANVVGRRTKDGDAWLVINLLGDSSHKIYTAIQDSKEFTAKDYKHKQGVYNFLRKAIIGGAHSHIPRSAYVGVVAGLFETLRSLHLDPVKLFSSDYAGDANDIRCFVVGWASHMVLVIKMHGSPLAFKLNTQTGTMEDVKDINRFAIFIGHHRCLAVDTIKFPAMVEANCMYYTEHHGLYARICKYNLKDRKEETISQEAAFLKQGKQFLLVAHRPFTIIHLLCSYTINIPDSQLALQHMSS